jgi:hypothetical protein
MARAGRSDNLGALNALRHHVELFLLRRSVARGPPVNG